MTNLEIGRAYIEDAGIILNEAEISLSQGHYHRAVRKESIPFLVDNAKRSPMLLTPRSLAVGRSRRSLAAVPRAAAAGVGTP